MSALRIVGGTFADLKNLRPTWNVEHEQTKRCTRCKRDLPYRQFFYRTFKNMEAGLPTATPSPRCNRCRTRKSQ